jgi:hypothetical protein
MFCKEKIFDEQWEEIDQIRDVINNRLNIELSISEAVDFWRWRSEQYDASWLGNVGGDNEIIKWFLDKIDNYYSTDPEYIDELNEKAQRALGELMESYGLEGRPDWMHAGINLNGEHFETYPPEKSKEEENK